MSVTANRSDNFFLILVIQPIPMAGAVSDILLIVMAFLLPVTFHIKIEKIRTETQSFLACCCFYERRLMHYSSLVEYSFNHSLLDSRGHTRIVDNL